MSKLNLFGVSILAFKDVMHFDVWHNTYQRPGPASNRWRHYIPSRQIYWQSQTLQIPVDAHPQAG